MLIRRIDSIWEIVVPSKINLFLEVLGRRPDGYHDLDTVMLAVSLCDRLRFRASDRSKIGFSMRSDSESGFVKLSNEDPAWEIPDGEGNLVVKALEALRKKFAIQSGLEVELIKSIPAQAGLGGGSSDAAAAIVGGMLAWTGGFHAFDAACLASELGSDINFFIEGRSPDTGNQNWIARCTGRGEIVQPIRSDWMIDFVIIHPPLGCSTKNIFNRIGEIQFASPASNGHEWVGCLARKDRLELGMNLFNRLEGPASEENPWIDQIRSILDAEPQVIGCGLSGSGSSVFAIVETPGDAEEIANRLKKRHPLRAFAVTSWQTPTISEQLSTMNGR